MGAESAYFRIISGQAGAWAAPLRMGLAAMSLVYSWAIRRRNRRFDREACQIARLPVPVISVGNITTGGTGKTPLVIDLAQRCLQRGRRPAVVARGYKSQPGRLGDEQQMLAERVPGVACFANPDRVGAIHDAIRLGVDAVLLDDGFQHRRVARDLDIVVVDATNPFGFEHVLPRGLLREPLTALRRAGVVAVSRVDQIEPTELGTLLDRLAQLAPGIPIVQCRHHPRGLTDIEGVPAEKTYHRALLFAGIGNPRSLVHSVRQLHIEPADFVWWPDHHRYSQADISRIRDARRSVEPDVVLTTHKDAVKLRGLKLDELDPLRVVAIDVAYMDDDEGVMNECLDSVLAAPPPPQVAEAPLGSVR